MSSTTVPVAARRAAVRARAIGALSRLSTTTALLAALSACGGGGDAPAPPPAPAPSPTGPIAAQMTVPAPVGYDTERLAAFDRLNAIRLSAGLGMLAQSTRMDQAAQAHAEWMVINDSFTHEETAGTQGFMGTNWARRDEAFGYAPSSGSEVIVGDTGGAQGVDALVNSLYHRCALLAIEPDDVGIGWTTRVASGFSTPLVIDLTRPATDALRGLGQQAQPFIDGAVVWPLDGAVEVPQRLGNESPNPVPAQDVLTLGTPVSITTAESRSIFATSFVLTRHDSGAAVPTQLLTNLNDPNFLIPHSFIAAVPLAALKPGTRYDVAFSGRTVDFGSTSPVPLALVWSFTTAAQ